MNYIAQNTIYTAPHRAYTNVKSVLSDEYSVRSNVKSVLSSEKLYGNDVKLMLSNVNLYLSDENLHLYDKNSIWNDAKSIIIVADRVRNRFYWVRRNGKGLKVKGVRLKWVVFRIEENGNSTKRDV